MSVSAGGRLFRDLLSISGELSNRKEIGAEMLSHLPLPFPLRFAPGLPRGVAMAVDGRSLKEVPLSRIRVRMQRVVLILLPLLAFTWSALDGRPQDAGDIAQLVFTAGTPKSVTVYPAPDGDSARGDTVRSGRLYWYLPYTLENKGTEGGKFFVTVRAYSDKGRRYSDLALADVEKRVEKLERRPMQSKADLLKAGEGIGSYTDFPAGKKSECVAIFNPIDAEADQIRVEIHGLVDDIEIEELPGGGFKVTERVLVLRYERPGDEFYTSLDSFEFKGQEWEKRVTETGR